MHRPYKAEKFVEICDQMKAARPDIAISTDIIVGFPGETEEDYLETKRVVERVDFHNAFVFRYSRLRNTPAAEMPDDIQVPERVKEERNQDLLTLVNRLASEKNNALVGQKVEILCEGASKTNSERLSGRTMQNKIVIIEGDQQRLAGEIFDVLVTESTGYTLYGDPVLHD